MFWDQLYIQQHPESKKLGICAECFMIQMFSAGNHFNTLGFFWTTKHWKIPFSLSGWLWERELYQPCWHSPNIAGLMPYNNSVKSLVENLPLQSSWAWIIVHVCVSPTDLWFSGDGSLWSKYVFGRAEVASRGLAWWTPADQRVHACPHRLTGRGGVTAWATVKASSGPIETRIEQALPTWFTFLFLHIMVGDWWLGH